MTIFGSLFALGAGYAFAKLHFRGRNLLFYMLVGSMVIPGIVTVLPNFILLSRLGLLDTLWAIILPNLALPFAMLWMRQYIQSAVPDSVLDAARIDGSGEFRTMWSVVAPDRPARAWWVSRSGCSSAAGTTSSCRWCT